MTAGVGETHRSSRSETLPPPCRPFLPPGPGGGVPSIRIPLGARRSHHVPMKDEGRVQAVRPVGDRKDEVKILLVDDSAPIRNLMFLLLDGHKGIAEVRQAEDGYSAVQLCNEFCPDLVVLD